MWPVLLAAAVAGSTGLVAKHILSPASDPSRALDPSRATDQEAPEPSTPRATISALHASESESSCCRSEEIFRFSSSGSGNARSKGSGKKLASPGSRKSVGKAAKFKGSCGNDDAVHGKSGRKFYICLKRRKIGKNLTPKSCMSKGWNF